jgi:hypothetical protein
MDRNQAQFHHNVVPAPSKGQAQDVLVLLKDYKLLLVTSSAGGSSTLPDASYAKGIMDDEAFEGQLCGSIR